LQGGGIELLPAPAGVLAYRRTCGDDARTVLVSFSGEPVTVAGSGVVEVASDGVGEGEPFGGVLGPDTAVVLR